MLDETDAEQELGPSVDVPDAEDAPRELRRKFWSLVVTFNVALLAVSLGVMFIGFQGRWRDGGLAVILGSLLFAWGYYKYRVYANEDPKDD